MARSAAERQAAYRAKRSGKDASERRLNTWVSAETYRGLEKLSERYGITRKALIELLVSEIIKNNKDINTKVKATVDRTSTKKAKQLSYNDLSTKIPSNPPAKTQPSKRLVRNERRARAETKVSNTKTVAQSLSRNKVKTKKTPDKQIDLFG